MHRHLALSALLLVLAACASEPKRNWARGERLADPADERPRPRPPVKLFISPSGEPFRGDHGLATWFAGADAGHDGSLTYAEFEADAMRWLKVLDANHDGLIDGFEIHAYEKEMVPEIGANDLLENQGPLGGPRAGGGGRRGGGDGGRRGGSGGPGGGGGQTSAAPDIPAFPGQVRGAGREGAARYGLLNEPEPVANADSDVDGRVSLAEWKVATKRRFDRLDRAKAGKLILSDLILPPDVRKDQARKPGPPPPAAPSR